MPISKSRKKKKKDQKNKTRANRPATGVLLDPKLAVKVLLGVPSELLPLWILLLLLADLTAGKPANTCTTACLWLQIALDPIRDGL
jgi:hypothetical protein